MTPGGEAAGDDEAGGAGALAGGVVIAAAGAGALVGALAGEFAGRAVGHETGLPVALAPHEQGTVLGALLAATAAGWRQAGGRRWRSAAARSLLVVTLAAGVGWVAHWLVPDAAVVAVLLTSMLSGSLLLRSPAGAHEEDACPPS